MNKSGWAKNLKKILVYLAVIRLLLNPQDALLEEKKKVCYCAFQNSFAERPPSESVCTSSRGAQRE